HVQDVRVLGAELRILQAPPRVGEVVRRHGAAVAPAGGLPEMEGVPLAVRGDLPALGDSRDGLERAGVEPREPLEDRVGDASLGLAGHQPRVERLRLGPVHEAEVGPARARGREGHADGGEPQQQEHEHPDETTQHRRALEPEAASPGPAASAAPKPRPASYAAPLSLTRWQYTRWAGSRRTSDSAGTTVEHGSNTSGQRVWKRQPGGGSIGDGTSPSSGTGFRGARGSGTGLAESSARVYGWRGASNKSSAEATSTSLPRYITATRSATWRTTFRLWVMNR